MDTPEETKGQPPRRHQEFEDPHFHDDVDFEPPSEDKEAARIPRSKKPARKLPPPRRRFED